MRRALCGLLVLTGCDVVFGLDRPMDGDAGVGGDARLFVPLIVDPDGDADADTIPNGTDLCPAIPSTVFGANEDTDGDGVGDLCDPAPLIPGDCLAVFDAFSATGTLSPHWRSSGEAIAQGNNQLEIPPGPQTVVFLDLPIPLSSVTVVGYIPNGSGGDRAIQVLVDHQRATGITGRACGVAREESGTAPSRVALVDLSDGMETELATSPLDDTPLAAGTSVQLGWNDRDVETGAIYAGRCRAELSDQNRMTVDTSLLANPPPGGDFALRTKTIGFNVYAIIGYARDCP